MDIAIHWIEKGGRDIIGNEARSETVVEQLIAGHAPAGQRRRVKTVNARIDRIVSQYHARSQIDYLKGISNNLKY